MQVKLDGMTIHLGSLTQLLEKGNQDKVKIVYCMNPHSFILRIEDSKFKIATKNNSVQIVDGIGFYILLKLIYPLVHIRRNTGYDLFQYVNGYYADNNKIFKIFLFGASTEICDEMKKRLQKLYDNVSVHHYSPGFSEEVSEKDTKNALQKISKFHPDIIWVGLTAPKQEKWVADNRESLIGLKSVKFIGCVGAVFDYYSGNKPLPHKIISKIGMEWLFRLMGEPKRLIRRTLVSLPKFIIVSSKILFRHHIFDRFKL